MNIVLKDRSTKTVYLSSVFCLEPTNTLFDLRQELKKHERYSRLVSQPDHRMFFIYKDTRTGENDNNTVEKLIQLKEYTPRCTTGLNFLKRCYDTRDGLNYYLFNELVIYIEVYKVIKQAKKKNKKKVKKNKKPPLYITENHEIPAEDSPLVPRNNNNNTDDKTKTEKQSSDLLLIFDFELPPNNTTLTWEDITNQNKTMTEPVYLSI